MAKAKRRDVSIGLRAKTGRAIAVVLSGPATAPRFITRTELSLADPADPPTSQPYHEVMDLPWEQAKIAVRKINKRVEAISSRALARLVREIEARGLAVDGVAIVGAGDRVLEKIGSNHIRAHAAEGVLFRHVLEVAAKENKLKSRAIDERKLDDFAPGELKRSAAEIRDQLAEIGKVAGSPWRADEKAAATAAWLALASRGKK